MILGIKKIGHMGTLDPPADGVLPVALGAATRLIEYAESKAKTYRTTFRLGITTDTDDMAGNVVKVHKVPPIPIINIEPILLKFTGIIDQIPPFVSAVHVEGRRAYDLARQGRIPRLKPRKVEIFSIEILNYEYPLLSLEIKTGPGVYIRSIARDLGEKLGCGGAVERLTRTEAGIFTIESAVSLEEIAEAKEKCELEKIIMKPLDALSGIVRIIVKERGYRKAVNGNPLTFDDVLNQEVLPLIGERQKVVIIDKAGNLIATARKENEKFIMEKVLAR